MAGMGENTTDTEVRGSAPAMSTKELLLDLYHDMKFVRPAVEAIQAEALPTRVRRIETRHTAEDARAQERSRLGSLSNKALVAIVLVTQAALAAWVALKP